MAHIHIFQHLCYCLGQWIEMVCLKSSRQGTLYEDMAIAFTPSLIADDGFNHNLEIQDLLCVGEQVADCFRQGDTYIYSKVEKIRSHPPHLE